MPDAPAVILITFAGRRDRMGLLKHYAEQAIRDGNIDEWHVWNCTRETSDARWLPKAFRALRTTADDRNYRLANVRIPAEPSHDLSFELRTGHDAHIVLIPEGRGPGYELVLGGWGNSGVAVRVLPSGVIPDHNATLPTKPDIVCSAPGALSNRLWRHVNIAFTRISGHLSINVRIDGHDALHFDTPDSLPRPFKVAVMSGYGNVAEWRFASDADDRVGLFYPTLDARFHPWNPVYRFYAQRAGEYANTVFIKCDDDIVYLDRERLADFVRFRRARPEYFLVSANVINNGVCGYAQQELGQIPDEVADLEMPLGGLRGSLWQSGTKATTVHRFFQHNQERFREPPLECLKLRARISINLVSWLGVDLPSFDTRFTDDEHDMTVTIPRYLRRENAIYLPFVASHLSYRPQDSEMDVPAILEAYRTMAGV